MSKAPPNTIGGGHKKVLYTLSTIARIGLRDSAKALTAKNACKACGLGMGGQRGGMTNELGEYPAVCNKSIQAQSTDIQPPIPSELFAQHPIRDFQALSGREIEHLGRLGAPLYKAGDSEHYHEITWDRAFDLITEKMRQTPPNRSFFYSSGRSSNEAGFVLQLLARFYGTNNVNNCSYYCHQATGVALTNTVGSATSTVALSDLSGCDLIFVIGANPASNHPRFIHKLKTLRERGGHVIVINPAKEPGLVRFAVPKSPKSLLLGGTEIASYYLQPRIGSDIFLFKGIAKALIETNATEQEFIEKYCEGYLAFAEDVTLLSWQQIVESCGVSEKKIREIAGLYSQSTNTVFAWGMGVTHHTHGVENVEYISNLALMRGMIGRPYAGLLPLRGHSNVQGIGTIGVKPVLTEDVFARIERVFGVTLCRTKGMDTLSCLEAAGSGNIDFALMMGGNLFSASPDTRWMTDAFRRIAFKVFLTTTLNHGHVNGLEGGEALVLPVTARDEEWEATTQESMFNFVRLSDGGIRRLEDVLPETTILSTLAERVLSHIDLDFSQFRRHREIRKAIAACVPGLEKLEKIDQSKEEFHVSGRLLHTPDFNTPNRKATFVIRDFQTPEKHAQFPFTLMTVRSEGQFNTIVYEEKDSYRNTDQRWSILMNPQDMARLSIHETTKVHMCSRNGEMRHLRVYPFDLPDGNIMAYFPEANVLIGREHDKRSHTPSFKSIEVTIRPEN